MNSIALAVVRKLPLFTTKDPIALVDLVLSECPLLKKQLAASRNSTELISMVVAFASITLSPIVLITPLPENIWDIVVPLTEAVAVAAGIPIVRVTAVAIAIATVIITVTVMFGMIIDAVTPHTKGKEIVILLEEMVENSGRGEVPLIEEGIVRLRALDGDAVIAGVHLVEVQAVPRNLVMTEAIQMALPMRTEGGKLVCWLEEVKV